MADPGALRTSALSTTSSSLAPSPPEVTLRELVALPLPGGAGTNLDFSLDGHHTVVLEDGWGASRALAGRSMSTTTVTAGAGSGARVQVWLLEWFGGPRSAAVTDDPGQSNRRLLSHCV